MTVFGDSVMKGIEYINNRYMLSGERFMHGKSDGYNNKSKLGCTSVKGIEILKNNLDALESGSVALIEYGGNDSDFDWDAIARTPDEQHEPKVSVEKFEQTICEMIALLRSKNVSPVLMTLPPIDPYRYFDFISKDKNADGILKWLGRKEVIYSFQEQYSNTMLKVALRHGTELIDVRDEFLKKRNFFPYISEDGIHPNSEGHRLIADTLEGYFTNKQAV